MAAPLISETMNVGARRVLTPSDVLHGFTPTPWIEFAPTKIREITDEDVRQIGPFFTDLEGGEQHVSVGRYLCIGDQGEKWTCSQIRDRVPVSLPDQEHCRLYVQLNPKPVACFDVPFPFVLQSGEKLWESQETGGIITWNEKAGADLDMRVVERTIFMASYIPYDDQVRLLPVPVPPTLEECCGYTGEARYVAFFWGAGDESYFADGRESGTGEWDGFKAFVSHRSVRPALRGCDLGSSEEDALHWLILDRHIRRISIAKTQVAEQLLRQQWGIPDQEAVLVVSKEEWERLVQELSARVHVISQQEVLTLEIAHQKQVQEMRVWLDRVSDPIPVLL